MGRPSEANFKITLSLMFSLYLNCGVMALLPEKLAQPEAPVSPAERLRHLSAGEAFSRALLPAPHGPGERALSPHSRTRGGLCAAAATGQNAGRTVLTQSPSPRETHLARPQKLPFLMASHSTAVPTPVALRCGTVPLGSRWPWALLPASPSPGRLGRRRSPRHHALLQERRTDPRSRSEPQGKRGPFSPILPHTDAPGRPREARGWPRSGRSSLPTTPSPRAGSHVDPLQASSPRKEHQTGEGSPASGGCAAACPRPLPALLRGRRPEPLSCPSCCVLCCGAPEDAPVLVGGRSSMDLNMDLEKIIKLFFPIKHFTRKEKHNRISVTVKRV